MSLKEQFWRLQDRYDAFMENKFQTHLACGIAGMIVGIYLASLIWHK